MPRPRVWVFFLCAAMAALVVSGPRAQSGASSSVVVLGNVGLPAIDEGVIAEESHTPHSPESVKREAIRDSLSRARLGAGGHYLPGRVIVKFRESASPKARASAVAHASPTASISERPSYTDFDIVRLDPNEDPEAVARQLNTSPAVEYAQASYR